VGPRAGLDAVEKRKILPLPGIEPGPFSPQPDSFLLVPSLKVIIDFGNRILFSRSYSER
jgi:hypothetical protein